MTTYNTLSFAAADNQATIGLRRPDVLNAINPEMCRELRHAIGRTNSDDDVRVVLLHGHGRFFCAGGDLKSDEGHSTENALDEVYKPALLSVFNSEKPVIAAVHGGAVGVGSALMLSCDLVVMAESAYVLAPFVSRGLIPDGGASWHLLRYLGRQRAFEIIVNDQKISAGECASIGMVNRVVSEKQLMNEARNWAAQIAEKAPLAVSSAKKALRYALDNNLSNTMSFEAELQNRLVATDDAKEGIAAFLDKREADFKGK